MITTVEREWLNNCLRRGGGFLHTFADAIFRADDDNVQILHPALVELMAKYPEYLPREEKSCS